jgi:hypothetical protein
MTIDTEKKITSILAQIKGELIQSLSDEDALAYVDWARKKLADTVKERKDKEILKKMKTCSDEDKIILRKQRRKYAPDNYPINLVVGDIVHVNYGFGYCNELSAGHYGIILSGINANMYFVVPLSSEPLKAFPFYFDDLNLPSKGGAMPNKKSYLRFDQMGSLHFRRLENVNRVQRLNIGKDRSSMVFSKIREYLHMSIDK